VRAGAGGAGATGTACLTEKRESGSRSSPRQARLTPVLGRRRVLLAPGKGERGEEPGGDTLTGEGTACDTETMGHVPHRAPNGTEGLSSSGSRPLVACVPCGNPAVHRCYRETMQDVAGRKQQRGSAQCTSKTWLK